MQARYCVVIEETHPDGWVVRRMLVARFVGLSEAMGYAAWRCGTCDRADWTWVVETANAVRSLYEFRPPNTLNTDRATTTTV